MQSKKKVAEEFSNQPFKGLGKLLQEKKKVGVTQPLQQVDVRGFPDRHAKDAANADDRNNSGPFPTLIGCHAMLVWRPPGR